MDFLKKFIIISGHYGTGKTNLSLNIAKTLSKDHQVTLVDLDIVNPYFRSSDYIDDADNIKIIAPSYSKSTLDIPALSPEIYSAFSNDGDYCIFDVGGDDAGATAIGRFSGQIKSAGYQMLYVVNKYRKLIAEPKQAVGLMREVEQASRLQVTGIFNNSHLGQFTTKAVVMDSIDYAKEVAKLTNLEVLATAVPKLLEAEFLDTGIKIFPVETLVTTPWQ